MSTIFRKTGVKIAVAVLLVLFLFASVFSGVAVLGMLGYGCYGGGSTLFEVMAENRLYQDACDIMHNYFDSAEPTKPWKSLYSGGIYTGENSNFIYTVTDPESGYAVLSTVEGGEPVCMKKQYTFHYDVQTESDLAMEDAYSLEGEVFRCADTIYVYSQADSCFYPADTMVSSHIAYDTTFGEDIYNTGFALNTATLAASGTGEAVATETPPVSFVHYEYDGYMFFPVEGWYEENVSYIYETKNFDITCYLLDDLPHSDYYRSLFTFTDVLYSNRYEMIVLLAVSILMSIVLMSVLGCGLGWQKDGEEPRVEHIFRLPSDVSLAAGMIAFYAFVAMVTETSGIEFYWAVLTVELLMVLGGVICFVYLFSVLCVRIKTHSLISGSLIYWCISHARNFFRSLLRGCEKALHYLPLLWKVGICYVGVSLLEFFLLMVGGVYYTEVVVLWFLLKLVLAVLVGYAALAFRRLKQGAESIAAGDYTTKVSDRYLVLDFKETADTLNHIGDGMNAAVDSRMKSERLKTELITNVSHDLKTPLTSIVSYVDLLKQEPAGSQAAEEYLEVLDRQSARLKKLIEDLVEASKASTGNIPMQKELLDFNMLLGQALGEYRERLENAGLVPVLKIPEDPCMVNADGRLLWRVFDNLLGNIVKYAMPGTRVYLTVEAGEYVTATFRNISREELAVTAEELMERFVRGDASRHTEGSGLGLSIARSLTESMGGSFDIRLDGDLFKAMVALPVTVDPVQPAESAEP